MSTGPARRAAPSLWWLSPAGPLLIIVPATLLMTAYLDDADFRLFYRSAKSVTDTTLLLIAAGAAVLVVCATLADKVVPARGGTQLLPARGTGPVLPRAADALFALTMLGYGVYFGAAFARGVSPADLLGVLVSQDNYGGSLRESFGNVAGLSTLTQVGIAFVVVASYLLVRRPTRRLVLQLGVVVVLSLARSFLASERLAIVEVALPAVVVLSMAARHHARPAVRWAARLAPLVLAPLLFALFAAFEYSRSWTFFSSRTEQPFLVFAGLRFAGYYSTAYNNGYLHLEHGTWPGRLPLDSLVGFWEAPGLAQLGLYDRLSAPPPDTAVDVLERFGNPEFNNPGGLTTPFVDFGLGGGFVFLAVVGVVIGLLYRGFRNGTLVGALLYPVAVTGLFDLPRYVYWTQGRVIPAVVALLVVALVVRRAVERERSAGPPDPAVSPQRARTLATAGRRRR